MRRLKWIKLPGAFGGKKITQPAPQQKRDYLGNDTQKWLDKFQQENPVTRTQECEYCQDEFFTLKTAEILRVEAIQKIGQPIILCAIHQEQYRKGTIKKEVDALLRRGRK